MKTLGGILILAITVGCDRPTASTAILPRGPATDGQRSGPDSSAPIAAEMVPVDDPSGQNVVVVAAAVFPPEARPGDVVTLAWRMRMAAGWHVFAVEEDGRNEQNGPLVPTRLVLDLPGGISADGDWELPEPARYDSPMGRAGGYSGDVTFRRRLKIDERQTTGTLVLPLTVSCQACGESICTRPDPTQLRPTLEVVAP